MRSFFVALAICFYCFAAHGQKTRLEQGIEHAKAGVVYPIKVHVSGIHYRSENPKGILDLGMPNKAMYENAVMDGKKVELQLNQEIPFPFYNFPLGDQQARLLKDSHTTKDTPLFREYELLLPDNTVWRFVVTGISE